MIHIVQSNLFKEQHYDMLIRTLERMAEIKDSTSFHMVCVFPFVNKLVEEKDRPEPGIPFDVDELPEFHLETDEPVFCWGSLKLSRIAKQNGWNPGVLHNDNHRYEVYSKWWGDALLNADSEILLLKDSLPWDRGNLFLRPTEDNKAFTGAVFDKEKWENTVSSYLGDESYPLFNENTPIQVSTPKGIFKEIRCWVVNDEIVTASYYRLGGQHYRSSEVEPEALDFAKSIIRKGSLADGWVLDICYTDQGEWKVVEAGCINHAGFYASDVGKTAWAIENFYD